LSLSDNINNGIMLPVGNKLPNYSRCKNSGKYPSKIIHKWLNKPGTAGGCWEQIICAKICNNDRLTALM
jgi:hypothetical protein